MYPNFVVIKLVNWYYSRKHSKRPTNQLDVYFLGLEI